MMFMGYKHEDFTLDAKYDEKDKKWDQVKHSYRELLSDIWEQLNGDKDNLKTMADIYTSTDNKYLKLSKDAISDYDEILAQAKQVGYYITYNIMTLTILSTTKSAMKSFLQSVLINALAIRLKTRCITVLFCRQIKATNSMRLWREESSSKGMM